MASSALTLSLTLKVTLCPPGLGSVFSPLCMLTPPVSAPPSHIDRPHRWPFSKGPCGGTRTPFSFQFFWATSGPQVIFHLFIFLSLTLVRFSPDLFYPL